MGTVMHIFYVWGNNYIDFIINQGARFSSMVRAFADGAMDRWIDSSWADYNWAISRSSQCSMTGVTKAVVYVILSLG